MPYLFELYKEGQDCIRSDTSANVDDILNNECLLGNSDIIDIEDIQAEVQLGIESSAVFATDDPDYYIVAIVLDDE